MNYNQYTITGIVPAAGNATRISPIPCSKEIFPVGFEHRGGSTRIKVVISHLLESYAEAGADQIYLIIQKGKWDIPQYLGYGLEADASLAYIVTEPTKGTHYTIDLSYPFVKDRMILLGFPDILFKPKNAFTTLLQKQGETGADVVLGLFETAKPNKADMVEVDSGGRLRNIVFKPESTTLAYTWAVAAWTPAFTRFLHQFVSGDRSGARVSENTQGEMYIGDVILEAANSGMIVDTVTFSDGEFIDIGTMSDLKTALGNGFTGSKTVAE
ncbi:MAG: sugar phosphate nucleotidyltransferase [Balneolaceae bacterium]|nr:sugar phosphate nucleotidyltransferase [Balneolaceae bacterium]